MTFHDEMVEKYGLPDWLPAGWVYKPAGKNKKPVCSFGINDLEFACQPRIGEKQVIYKLYQTWHDMIKRTCDPVVKKERKAYIDVTIDAKWLHLSNFVMWALPKYKDGYVLDKDICVRNNTVYSETTCIFVPPIVNGFVLTNKELVEKSNLPMGVSLVDNKYIRSRIKNPFTNTREHLGIFNTELEAHKAWQKAKIAFGLELAKLYKIPELALAMKRIDSDYINNLLTKDI